MRDAARRLAVPARPAAVLLAALLVGTVPGAPSGAVTGRGPAAVRTAEDEPPPPTSLDVCPPPPEGELDKAKLPPVPEGAMVLPLPDMEPFPAVPACAYAVGFANVRKQRQAAVVNDPAKKPALAALNMTRRFVTLWDPPEGQQPYFEADTLAHLQLPPAETTFLTYGFMPTSAVMELVPQGLLTIVATGNSDWDQPAEFTITGYQWIKLRDVKVNGVPLDVGPNCRTARPVALELKGRQDDYLPGGGDGKPDYTLQGGGPLSQRNLVIPEFRGCGSAAENLDALFTAAVSGPGNSLNLVQGAICTPTSDQPNGCEPQIELPALPHRLGTAEQGQG